MAKGHDRQGDDSRHPSSLSSAESAEEGAETEEGVQAPAGL